MRVLALSVALAAAVAAVPVSASAVVYNFEAFLNGLNEAPPVVTPGSGYATLVWDTDLHSATLNVTWSDLIGTTTVSHIHARTLPTQTTIFPVATTTPSFPMFPTGVTAGSYMLTFATNAASSYNPSYVTANGGSVAAAEAALLANIIAGEAYLNIHSNFRTGGEIRAPFAAVPEPATWALMIGGFGAVGWSLRTRRRLALVR